MIVEYLRYDVADPVAFSQAYEAASESLDASPHCLAYELSRCTEDPKVFILRIEWDSAEGHLQGFRKSPEFTPFFRAVQPFLRQILEMRHYEITSVVSRKAK